MRILALELLHVAIPFAQPYRLSKVYGTAHVAEAIVVKVTMDDGTVAYGEADPKPPFTEETPGGVLRALAEVLGPAVIGADPTNVNELHERMDTLLSGNSTAKGALDIACHDALGKATGLPLHVLLGGALVRELPVLWPTSTGTAADDAAVIDHKLEEGYRTFMLKMGAAPVREDIARVGEVLGRYGDRIRLSVDANQGWEPAEALAFVEGVRGLAIEYIEQPVAAWNVGALARLRKHATQPISADEALFSQRDALRLAALEAADVFSVKVSKNGGVAPSRRIAEIAHAGGIRCLMNSMLEFGITQAASLHLGATLPNLVGSGHCYMSTLRMADDFTDFSAQVQGGIARLRDAPGLGVTIDEDKLAHYSRERLRVDGASATVAVAGRR